MTEISMTEFVDFIIKSGTSRFTEVRRIKAQHKRGYHPSYDYYKKIRDGVIEYHQHKHDKPFLDSIAKGIRDQNKQLIYPILVKAYKKFLGKKEIDWFEPAKAEWHFRGLNVKVNPELGLKINGTDYLVKLYFKEEPKLTKHRIKIISNLLNISADPGTVKPAVLDVRRSKLIDLSDTGEDIKPLLEGEAMAFITMYDQI